MKDVDVEIVGCFNESVDCTWGGQEFVEWENEDDFLDENDLSGLTKLDDEVFLIG